MIPSLTNVPLYLNAVIFIGAGVVIWQIGTRLSHYADLIADRTGLGRAMIGLILLAAATSLPEIGTTVTASSAGNVSLAVSNLFGSVITQSAVLAIADIVVARRTLTYFTPDPELLLEGLLLVIILSIVLAGAIVGEIFVVYRVGLWTFTLVGVYVLAVYLLRNYERRKTWKPVNPPDRDDDTKQKREEQEDRRYADWSTRRLALFFGAGSAVILVAGTALALVGDAIVQQTGLGESFVGATLLGAATSLPEISTTIAAVQIGAYGLAISNIFGSNMFATTLIFLSDVFYREGAALEAVGRSATFAATMGIVVTTIYLIGLVERRNRVVLRMGIDSLLVLAMYGVALGGLYYLS